MRAKIDAFKSFLEKPKLTINHWIKYKKIEISGSDRFRQARTWWNSQLSDFKIQNNVHGSGTGPVLFTSFSFIFKEKIIFKKSLTFFLFQVGYNFYFQIIALNLQQIHNFSISNTGLFFFIIFKPNRLSSNLSKSLLGDSSQNSTIFVKLLYSYSLDIYY